MKIYPINPETQIIMPGCNFVGGVYLHGDIQDIVNYDLIQMDQNDIKYLDQFSEGVFDVDVIFEDGCSTSCTLYFWKSITDFVVGFKCEPRTQYRGLIVSKTDKAAIEDAEKKFKEKTFWL